MRPLWGDEQVHVIGHQHVGVHAAFEAMGQFLEVVQVKPVILLGEKAGDTVVSPLNDVQGNACKPQTRTPWHFGIALEYTSIPRIQRSYWVTR